MIQISGATMRLICCFFQNFIEKVDHRIKTWLKFKRLQQNVDWREAVVPCRAVPCARYTTLLYALRKKDERTSICFVCRAHSWWSTAYCDNESHFLCKIVYVTISIVDRIIRILIYDAIKLSNIMKNYAKT